MIYQSKSKSQWVFADHPSLTNAVAFLHAAGGLDAVHINPIKLQSTITLLIEVVQLLPRCWYQPFLGFFSFSLSLLLKGLRWSLPRLLFCSVLRFLLLCIIEKSPFLVLPRPLSSSEFRRFLPFLFWLPSSNEFLRVPARSMLLAPFRFKGRPGELRPGDFSILQLGDLFNFWFERLLFLLAAF